ncbi:MAG: VIT1/CCC1 transporter family protein [Acidimicrobiia bacterium]
MAQETDAETTERHRRLYLDEMAAADLYRRLAAHADPELSRQLGAVADAEDQHAEHWVGLLREAGTPTPAYHPPFRVRALGTTARLIGVERVLPLVARMEAGEVRRYRGHDDVPDALVDEEVEHGRLVAGLGGGAGVGAAIAAAEGRHRIGVGDSLRPLVFGANDGLVSNLSLVMGVAGGTSDESLVLLAGVAGLVAGACSMAAGEWISVRAQAELYERELEVERYEIRDFPEEETEELETIYRSRGFDKAEARALAERLMEDEEVALDVHAREELGITPGELPSSWVAAVSSFLAFAVGAFVPVLPYVIMSDPGAFITAAVLSGVALFCVGALISIFTGRNAFWSGLRMVLIGGGAAVVTYGIGTLIGTT